MSTWSPACSVPTRSWFASPGSWIARRFPVIFARMPCSASVENRRSDTCSPA